MSGTEISKDDEPTTLGEAAVEAVQNLSSRIPADAHFRKLRVWLRFMRIKLVPYILLPELKWGEARELRRTVEADGELTTGYMLMCALSAGIATLGLLQSSTAVVIGAMLISPLMSPIAALGFGFASIDGARIRKAARVVAIGAAIGILTAILLTWLSPIRNATPEILARTEPTLLDLAVALFSGIAGGYATVIGKGGTAIGVAIATALMPPLAVFGYGIGVLQLHFALGALLLFLTNLAAITLSFAVIARLSGAARPMYAVEWKAQHIAIIIAAFLVLAVPLSMTLSRLTQEASLRIAAREVIVKACGGKNVDIAQIDVTWPLFGAPTVDALVVAPTYSPNAEAEAEAGLTKAIGGEVSIHLQQVQAANLQSQTRAMIDAAMERTAAGIAADVPPFDKIRADLGVPTRAIWTNRAERRVYVEPAAIPGWTLADYAAIESQANGQSDNWTVRVVPPPQPQMRVNLDIAGPPQPDALNPDVAVWALQRWGMGKIALQAPAGAATDAFVQRLAAIGITASVSAPEATAKPITRKGAKTPPPPAPVAVVEVYPESPTQQAAQAAAALAKAQADAQDKAKAAAQGEQP